MMAIADRVRVSFRTADRALKLFGIWCEAERLKD